MIKNSKKIRELKEAMRAERDIRIRNRMMAVLYPLTSTLRFSAVESVWRYAKYRLVTSEHHETLEDLTHVVSEYFRACSIRLDIYKFLYRCM